MLTAQSDIGAAAAKLILPFVNSARRVFSTMVGVEPTLGKPTLKANPSPEYEVSGIIGFSGQLMGSVVVSFQREAAVRLVKAFAGTQFEPGTPDFADAIGELANMIAGGAKKDLGGSANIGLPTVIMGKGHAVTPLSDAPCVVIPCSTPAGDFAIQVSIRQARTTNPTR
jgi:chemotaxis protein CheX